MAISESPLCTETIAVPPTVTSAVQGQCESRSEEHQGTPNKITARSSPHLVTESLLMESTESSLCTGSPNQVTGSSHRLSYDPQPTESPSIMAIHSINESALCTELIAVPPTVTSAAQGQCVTKIEEHQGTPNKVTARSSPHLITEPLLMQSTGSSLCTGSPNQVTGSSHKLSYDPQPTGSPPIMAISESPLCTETIAVPPTVTSAVQGQCESRSEEHQGTPNKITARSSPHLVTESLLMESTESSLCTGSPNQVTGSSHRLSYDPQPTESPSIMAIHSINESALCTELIAVPPTVTSAAQGQCVTKIEEHQGTPNKITARSSPHLITEPLLMQSTGSSLCTGSPNQVIGSSHKLSYDPQPTGSPPIMAVNESALCTETIAVPPTVTSTVQGQCESRSEEHQGQQYKKPKRPCPFCHTYQSQLTRHIRLKHKNEPNVATALGQSKSEKATFFAKCKKEGIMIMNKQKIMNQQGSNELDRERKSKTDSETVICSNCDGFYNKEFFHRHKRHCIGDSALQVQSLPSSLLSRDDIEEEFKKDILSRFNADEVGTLCRTDKTILIIGQRLFKKQNKKKDKKHDVRRVVMTDMRKLAGLYTTFKQVETVSKIFKNDDASDMFERKNFNILETAIEKYTKYEDGTVKPGLKMSLYYLLKAAAKILKGVYLVNDKDAQATAIDKFVEVLELHHNQLFGDAIYETNKARQEKLRKPQQLPEEEDIMRVRDHTIEQIKSFVSDEFRMWTAHDFKELRDCVVSRLTLFNARRGGEPSRMRLKELQDAVDNVWVDKRLVQDLNDPMEKALAAATRITYQSGKGINHLVPVLIPLDTFEGMRLLADAEVRSSAGVNKNNTYVFASTQDSDNHVSGWHAINSVAREAGVKDTTRLTATKMRHRISTLYAALDVPESQRHVFYQHMGHSENINKNVYQAPLSVLELTHVGKHLETFDRGNKKCNYFS